MISTLQYITQDIEGTTHADLIEKACSAGIRWVQLRVKNKSIGEWHEIAEKARAVCEKYQATFIINDSVQLAKELNAHGVHLGKEDMPVQEARAILGNKAIIGGTANTLDEVINLTKNNVDYIGLGPFRFTSTKEKLSPVLGLEGYRYIISQLPTSNFQLPTPIIAIGGILPNDVKNIISTGIHGVAVSSGIHNSNDVSAAVKEYLQHFQHKSIPNEIQ